MKKESVLFGVIGLVLGSLLMMAFAANAVNSQNKTMMGMMGIGLQNNMMQVKTDEVQDQLPGMGMGTSMNELNDSMKSLSGYEFDKAFINAMIVHHEGAIAMANQALHKSGHQELKDMAQGIIDAQSSEIEQMKQWKKDWMME